MSDHVFGDKKDDPANCSCWDLTMVGFSSNQYAPSDERGRPTGHHPLCQYYEMPPRFACAKSAVKEVLKCAGPTSLNRDLAFAIYDIISFLEKEFPNRKADGKS